VQAAGDGPTLDALASAEAAHGRKGAMSALKGEGIGASKPGEPLRGVGIDHLITAIGGEGNHRDGARGRAGVRRGIEDGGGSNGGRRRSTRHRRSQGSRAAREELEQCQGEASHLLLECKDLELHLSQLGVDIGGGSEGGEAGEAAKAGGRGRP
jgi:hypothetical protein